MSKKIKCNTLSKRGLLYTLIIFVTSSALFAFLPFINNHEVGADLMSSHTEDKEKVIIDDKLSIFHENTVIALSETVVTPVNEVEEEVKTTIVLDTIKTTLTGYSSTVDQTNSEPFITASGSWVRDGIVAANFLPFNSKIRIPELFGDKIFVVEDRMNQRYSNRVDVWFSTRQEAINFGRKSTYIEIIQ